MSGVLLLSPLFSNLFWLFHLPYAESIFSDTEHKQKPQYNEFSTYLFNSLNTGTCSRCIVFYVVVVFLRVRFHRIVVLSKAIHMSVERENSFPKILVFITYEDRWTRSLHNFNTALQNMWESSQLSTKDNQSLVYLKEKFFPRPRIKPKSPALCTVGNMPVCSTRDSGSNSGPGKNFSLKLTKYNYNNILKTWGGSCHHDMARPLGCGWGSRPPDMEVSCEYIE